VLVARALPGRKRARAAATAPAATGQTPGS
jgi:hypothetical protein